MRRFCLLLVGIVLTFPLGGCSESQEEGPISYKGTDSPAIRKQLELQSANAKSGNYATKPAEDKPAAQKVADKKPAGDPAAEKK